MADDVSEEPAPDEQPPDEPVDSLARRRRGSGIGGVVGSAMLGMAQAVFGKPKEDAPIVVEASGEPGDIDEDGIVIAVDEETSVVAPPPSRRRHAAHPPAASARTKRYRGDVG